jgi:hypothetical protein
MTTPLRIGSLLTVAIALLASQTAFAFYNPQLGRWANRDPIEETGGLNLYRVAANDPINSADSDGLAPDGPTPSEMGAAECARQNIKCFRECWKRRAPYPWGKYTTPGERKAAKYRFCEEKCQAEYMECMKRVEERCKKASQGNLSAAALAAALAAGAVDAPVLGGCSVVRIGGGVLTQ